VLLIIAIVLALIFLPWPWSLSVIIAVAIFELSLMTFGIRYTRRRRATVGVQTLVGTTAEVITPLTPKGQVRLNGEIWEAHATRSHAQGETVRVLAVNGLTLEVD
jgi:membrane-bound serine protease (ClpP class)